VDAQPEDRRPSRDQLRQLGHAVRLHHLSTNFLVDVVPLVAWLYEGHGNSWLNVVTNRMTRRPARATGVPDAWLPSAPKRKVGCRGSGGGMGCSSSLCGVGWNQCRKVWD
jgi:hypothetical protein